jgi:tRNA N6-adenosine threonylcarbamoyltransferase
MTAPPLPSNFTILAIETSYDETAAAVVRGGREVISNVAASQIEESRRYGGIIPEVASSQHILALPVVVEAALAALPDSWQGVHAVAATYGSGRSSALRAGLNAAKAIAWLRDLPFVGVNHVEAHIYANWLIPSLSPELASQQSAISDEPATAGWPPPQFPLVALIVSGAHTLLALLEGHGSYRLLGQTRDDTAGEAFDKAAQIMGLGLPGGPAIERAAANAPGAVALPRTWLRDSYDFSFSGLKTAVLHQVQGRREREEKVVAKSLPQRGKNRPENLARRSSPTDTHPEPLATGQGPRATDRYTAQLAYAFQESVVDVLVTKTVDAARAFGATEILLAGGLAANMRLREELARRASVPVRCPALALCGDNAAMIGAAAFYRFDAGSQSGWDLDVEPNLRLA